MLRFNREHMSLARFLRIHGRVREMGFLRLFPSRVMKVSLLVKKTGQPLMKMTQWPKLLYHQTQYPNKHPSNPTWWTWMIYLAVAVQCLNNSNPKHNQFSWWVVLMTFLELVEVVNQFKHLKLLCKVKMMRWWIFSEVQVNQHHLLNQLPKTTMPWWIFSVEEVVCRKQRLQFHLIFLEVSQLLLSNNLSPFTRIQASRLKFQCHVIQWTLKSIKLKFTSPTKLNFQLKMLACN